MEMEKILIWFAEFFFLSNALVQELAEPFNSLLQNFPFSGLFGRIVVNMEISVFRIILLKPGPDRGAVDLVGSDRELPFRLKSPLVFQHQS